MAQAACVFYATPCTPCSPAGSMPQHSTSSASPAMAMAVRALQPTWHEIPLCHTVMRHNSSVAGSVCVCSGLAAADQTAAASPRKNERSTSFRTGTAHTALVLMHPELRSGVPSLDTPGRPPPTKKVRLGLWPTCVEPVCALRLPTRAGVLLVCKGGLTSFQNPNL